jgi:hypothetical protein
MADNATISTASGNVVVGADEVSSTLYQRVKPVHSADGVAPNDTQLASATVLGPLPVNAYLATDYILAAGLALTPKFAVINLNATGTLVAAVANKKIRVLAVAMTIDNLTGDETYGFNSGAAGTALTGLFGDGSGVGNIHPVVMPFNPVGWFETAVGTLLEMVIAGTTPFADGCLVYAEV